MISSIAYAYDFEVDGLCYNIIASDQVEVTYRNYHDDTNYSGDIQIPSTVIYNNISYRVTSIGNDAFYNCYSVEGHLASVTIPNTVISIGDRAFSQCYGLAGTLTLPNNLTSIGEDAFNWCSELTGSLIIPNSVKTIGSGAFGYCTNFTGQLMIPNSIKTISDRTFSGCYRLTSLTISDGVTYIGSYAFAHCKGFTGKLIIPNSVSYIGWHAFDECSGFTGELTIPNSVTDIMGGAFSECSGFTGELSIPNAIVYIGEWTFYKCSGIYSLTIPETVKTIGGNAFGDCFSLSSVISEIETPFSIDESVFNGISSSAILSVPYGTKSKYQNYSGWTKHFSSIEEFGGVTSYTLSIKATGNGSASYSGETIRGKTKSYSVNDGTSVTISFTPDNGYRIKSLKVNGSSVTATTSYKTTINADTSIEVEFEAIPPTTYTLSIKVTGNGSASYSGESIRGKTKTYTVNEGTSVTVSFTPDDGYRIKSLKVNGSSVTVTSSYTTTINADTSIEVVFEEIPPTTYTLSIKATGNGSASYNGETIRGKTSTFTVNEGTSIKISFTPDDGYRIKSLKVNGSSVTANTSYKTTINADTSIEVEFEEIPQVDYTLSIKAVGNGSASYNGETIRETTKNYSVTGGSSITLTFTPDNGYRIKSLKVNGSNVTASSSYKTTVNGDTNIEVEFEKIPITYTFTIKASGNGFASYEGESIREATMNYTVNEGSTVTVSFNPDDGYWTKSLIVNGVSMFASSDYTTTINEDTSIEVEFAESVSSFSMDGITYQVVSMEGHTVMVIAVGNELVLDIPEKVSSQNQEWTVIGINDDVLEGQDGLAAIIWGPAVAFTGRVTNPNLLLYVKDEAYAPASIKNVVVNGSAKSITLTDAQSGNNFYCPEAFTAQSINYTHNYLMKTGLHESRGWETIALPFDVQQISHSSKGEIVPFARWTSGGNTKPFWLYELSGSGFVEAEAIKANTPYIISMPNNEAYPNEYHLNGKITFSSVNVKVEKSDELQIIAFNDRSFVPNFICRDANAGYYALNVSNDYEFYQGSENEGSKFIQDLRKIHPFEAYMTTTSNTRSIGIFDDMTTTIRGIEIVANEEIMKVYDLSGKLLRVGTSLEDMKQGLPAGVYIVNHQKILIK